MWGKIFDISSEDGTKLRNFLGNLSSPLDDMLCLFNTLEVRFWMRKLMNAPGRVYSRDAKMGHVIVSQVPNLTDIYPSQDFSLRCR